MTDMLPGIPLVESPLFEGLLAGGALPAELEPIARQLNERGYAVIDFPDPKIFERIERIKANLGPRFGIDVRDPEALKTQGDNRIQDAWQFDDDVAAIASNSEVVAMLGALWGRRAFPFQTLNFPVGTQQAAHSDSVHFSSLPERFMCGVWLAMEDIDPDAGPLLYYPGSHRWPLLSNLAIGHKNRNNDRKSAQAPFEEIWQAIVAAQQLQPETFLARKGQALIWSANLLHGGSPQADPRLTRWSQVTHYYFEDCIYYTPAFSDEAVGRLDVRSITDVSTGKLIPNLYMGEEVSRPEAVRLGFMQRLFGKRPSSLERTADLPEDFDETTYLKLNPDVARGSTSGAEHYLRHGCNEGRRYRL
ncbi:MAG: phytanoyl-CoA dioxygenase family protein [Betaproteobacteria bacterium]|nr:phytanoyl-CoA dioxygenase family protein [Betaproteobacteria bacterium]